MMALRWRWLLMMLAVVSSLSLGGLAQTAQAQSVPTIALVGNPTLGQILTANNGLTLYVFMNDTENTSACNGGCAAVWPPLLVDENVAPTAGTGVSGVLGTTVRQDGKRQVTYNGLPLYFFAGNAAAPADTQPGNTNGQGIGGVWFVVKGETRFVGTGAVDVARRSASTFDRILTAKSGFTLYQFKNDKANESVCYDGCARVWPPLLLGKGILPTAGQGVSGELGVTVRRDGGRQVTYNGSPLYFFAGNAAAPADAQPGDTNGQGVGGVWFVNQIYGTFLPITLAANLPPVVYVRFHFTCGGHVIRTYCFAFWRFAQKS
ncbi:MAG: hypothetical protein H7Z42_05790, partial [Roseiflexaceae bacterium]|nr:hypothetical protein [Roseiflexaceae bacterium]